MSYYVPGTEERDQKKVIMSLQQTAGNTATNTTNIATNTANIATNTANIAANTANIATNTTDIASLQTTVVNLQAWKVANLRANNTAGFVSVAMDVTADYAILYNPVTGGAQRAFGSALTKTCTISTAGPASGGRDRASAFASGDVVWFYYIWGSAPGVGITTSLTGPISTNGGGTTGPVLPSGYTHYAPCFPVPMVGSATLNPAIPQGGTTQFQVRGNTVSYPNIPELIGAGYPVMSFDVSTWAPPSVALLTNIMCDFEIHSSAGGAVIGGAVPSTSLGNFGNASLYPPVASSWYAQNPSYSVPLPSGLMTITFLSSSGVIDNAIGEVWINGYTFSNGD